MAAAQAPKAYEVKEGAAQDVDITSNDITEVDLFITLLSNKDSLWDEPSLKDL